VRVIARGTLTGFVAKRLDRKHQKLVQAQLEAWYAEAAKATWQNSAELKAQYTSASIVSAERVVFNIKGNEYRLIVYRLQIVFILWLGTHREYDAIDARKVQYEPARYSHPSDQNA
jgi:mRNA interferase HigB